jgi:hypothetical protein
MGMNNSPNIYGGVPASGGIKRKARARNDLGDIKFKIGLRLHLASVDGLCELTAGAMSVDPDIAIASGRGELLAPDRIYTDYREMAEKGSAPGGPAREAGGVRRGESPPPYAAFRLSS